MLTAIRNTTKAPPNPATDKLKLAHIGELYNWIYVYIFNYWLGVLFWITILIY